MDYWICFLGELNQYVTNFQWDVAKYPLIKQTTLRNLAEIIGKVYSISLYQDQTMEFGNENKKKSSEEITYFSVKDLSHNVYL